VSELITGFDPDADNRHPKEGIDSDAPGRLAIAASSQRQENIFRNIAEILIKILAIPPHQRP
jgi:hypothetical protein